MKGLYYFETLWTYLFAKICSHFSSKQPLHEKKPHEYEKLVYLQHDLTSIQIKKGSWFISGLILLIFNLWSILGNLDIFLRVVLNIIGINIFFFNSQFFFNQIKRKEYKYLNYYQLFLIEIQILLKSLNENEERSLIILKILHNHSEMTANLHTLLSNIAKGCNITENLSQIQFFSPSLNEFFCNLMKNHYNFDLVQTDRNFKTYYENKFDEFTKSLETRLAIFYFLVIFFPITVIFISFFYAWDFSRILSIFIMYIVIHLNFTSKLLQNDLNLLGLNNFDDPNTKREFIAFLNFLSKYYDFLSFEIPDRAIIDATHALSYQDQKILYRERKFETIECWSAKKILIKLISNLKNVFIKSFLTVVLEVVHRDPSQGSSICQDISHLINQQMLLYSERVKILRNAQYKIIIYKFLIGFILGVLTPFLYKFHEISSNFIFIFNQPTIIGTQSQSMISDYILIYFVLILAFFFIEYCFF